MRRFGFMLVVILALFLGGCSAQSTTMTSTAASEDETPASSQQTLFVPTPTSFLSAASIKAGYLKDVDIRELYKDISRYNDRRITYEGNVLTIQVSDDLVFVQVTVPYSDNSGSNVVDLAYPPNFGTNGVVEGTHIRVYGRPLKMFTITNSFGAQIDQPLLIGDYMDIVH